MKKLQMISAAVMTGRQCIRLLNKNVTNGIVDVSVDVSVPVAVSHAGGQLSRNGDIYPWSIIKKCDLCLTLRLQVRMAYGIDYIHNGSIRSYGVIFPEIKEYGYEKSGIPVHEALQSPLLQSQRSFQGQGHIVEKLLHRTSLYIQKYMCKVSYLQLYSFIPNQKTY